MRSQKLSFKAKTIFGVFCLIITLSVQAQAVANIGTTKLLYQDNFAINSILTKISATKPKNKFQINDKMMQVIAKQMPGFQSLLNTVLIESGDFTVFDAESDLDVWKAKDPLFLRMVYKTTEVEPPLQSESKPVKALYTTPTPNPNQRPGKLILLGWVDNITDDKNKGPIYDTGKVSLIFSIDIQTEYRLINTRTNKVVAAFTAVGHGGVARILPGLNETISYDVNTMVNDMFYSLAKNVRHGLALKQQQFIKEKIQLENASKQVGTQNH